MNRVVCTLMIAGLTAGCDAEAVGSLASITLVDRDSGATLTPWYHHGEYWVAGRPGARYAIEIHNRLGERLLAVTSVDGVNVLSGQNAGWDQSGYVFSPGERYQVTGWRKSDSTVAAFTFTESPDSYAERTGRPANVGVIGVALFRERPAPVAYAEPPVFTAPGADARESRSPAYDTLPSMQAPTAKLGTGHGGREYSYVSHTEFQRMQQQPNEVIRIRYDSLDRLVAMGVIARPRTNPPGADPFPASRGLGYVPDPPG